MAQIIIKKNGRLVNLGEGKIYSKSQLKLNEIDANIGMANGIQQAQMKAKQLMNQNSGVDSASADAGHIDNQQDTMSGEGIKLELPVNANAQQLAQAQRMAKDPSADDAQIVFTKNNSNNDISNPLGESRIMELRRNSVPFTKSELGDFLKSL